MAKDFKYMVFRIYTADERINPDSRAIFYGWTRSKNVLKGFFTQRSRNKYKVIKMTDESIARDFSEDTTDFDTNIDILKIKSVKGDEVVLFATSREIHQAEIDIQRMFHESCSLENINGKGNYISMITNLDEYYGSALSYIGYRPREFDILFQSADPRDSYNPLYKTEEEINDAYDGLYTYPDDDDINRGLHMEGLSAIEDVSSRVIYSLESFIKVLKKDL